VKKLIKLMYETELVVEMPDDADVEAVASTLCDGLYSRITVEGVDWLFDDGSYRICDDSELEETYDTADVVATINEDGDVELRVV
jgi:hypothetical protein